MPTILLVAAEPMEFAGLVCRAGGTLLRWAVRFAKSTEYNGSRFVMVANGPGPKLAGEATAVGLRQLPVDVVVSTGLCGALSPALQLGDILVATRVLALDQAMEFAACSPRSARRFSEGSVVSVDRVAVTASDKRSLRDRGGDIVEMEAAGVAQCASERGIPFFCVRSVSDCAEEGLVLDFNAYRDKQGRFSRPRIVAAAVMHPWSRIPALMRLNRNARAAADTLGEFLADCRF